jgi:hypothetical protein
LTPRIDPAGESPEYLRWCCDQLRQQRDRLLGERSAMNRSAYTSVVSLVVVAAFAFSVFDSGPRWLVSSTASLLTVATAACTYCTFRALRVEWSTEVNAASYWAEDLRSFGEVNVLRTLALVLVDGVKDQIAEINERGKWVARAQLAALVGLAVAILACGLGVTL